jgi:S-adenosylmethionine-diacylglycerol 3-amino-3-carboxypropyl transferase
MTLSLPGFAGRLGKRVHDRLFNAVHGNRLIYNTCWEDPRLDRELLGFDSDSRVVMITSAGCNALDYLLDDPAHVHCVDMNFRQNAVLELKRPLRRGENGFKDLFALFGAGAHPRFKDILASVDADLPCPAKEYWQGQGHENSFQAGYWNRPF